MSNTSNYDPNEDLLSPSAEAMNRILNLPSIPDFNIAQTPPGMNPSNRSSSSSPPQSTTLSEIYPFDEYDFNVNGNGYQPTPFDNLGTTLPQIDHFEPNSPNSLLDPNCLGLEDDKLSILAQPKAFYRERYPCEIDPTKNRAQRYIRTDHVNKYEHPTIRIPLKWRNLSQQLYIRVTPVTIKTKNIPYHCIHPYEISTQEKNVLKDIDTNSLYFPVSEKEMYTGEKSFLISRTKMIQNDLKAYGPFRLFDTNQFDHQRIYNSQDAKEKIKLYQLMKSQFVFTIAEVQNSKLVPILHTSVESCIMTDETVVATDSPPNQPNITSINGIKCIPQQGNWAGGDEIVIIMPKPIKRKEYTICFDFREYGGEVTSINEIILIDTKTLLFQTPPCPFLQGDYDLKASIIIKENKSIISQIDFNYITPIKTVFNLCTRCQGNVISNKRRCEYDGGESLISQMNQLSIEQKPNESHSRITSEEKDSKLDKYLYQLKDALEIFLRKNDPSQLFRRTRILLSKYGEDSSPLNDVIQNGHTQIALSLIEQVIDIPSPNRLLENGNENGETPLLIAARLNQWKLIESILKTRSDLVKQKDKDGNNLFHLLANLSEDKGFETVGNILKILPNDIKNILKEEKNGKNETPMDIAQSYSNTKCMNLLTLDVGKKNDE